MSILRQKRNNRVIFLFGPTAVGKTELLCSLFSHGYEVVNADSVQVYRKLDIGSAKADEKTRQIIPHHLIDILDPWEKWDVASFVKAADSACTEIRANGNVPVISGGTAFYFKNFLYGLSQAPESVPQIRREVAVFIENVGLQRAHEYLKEIDPVSAKRINVNDSYRISRAIEVFKTCGKPLSSFEVPSVPRNDMDVLAIGLYRDREILNERIRKRVDIMFDSGLTDEIRYLLSIGADSSWQSMQGIGYREFISRYEQLGDFEKIDIREVKNEIVMNSIHYAKRQMTFFRSFADVNWVDGDDVQSVGKLLDHIDAQS